MKKWECTICGYIHEGEEPPEECPICSADASMFVEVTEETEVKTEEAAPESVKEPETASSENTPLETISRLIVRHHLHPITVHGPNGIIPMTVLFLAMAFFLGLSHFEAAAFFSLTFVLLSMPGVLFSGYIMWKKRYNSAMTSFFKIKIGAGLVTLMALAILVIWRLAQPEIVVPGTSGRWLYFLLHLVLLGAVGTAGHMGGKLVFDNRNK